MKKLFVFTIMVLFALALTIGCSSDKGEKQEVKKETALVTIGTGSITGVYYPTGEAIAKIVNKKQKNYNIRCVAESTSGSVFNINAVMAGEMEFGVVQSDRQYQAINGLAEWKNKGEQKDLRAVFSIHPEAVTLCATVESGIEDMKDLIGKRVSLGNHGSGQRQNAIDALEAVGIGWETDLIAENLKAEEALILLQEGKLDAFFYTVGHPSRIFEEATSGKIDIRFVEISSIEGLLAQYPYYTRAYVPIDFYPQAKNDDNIYTFGVKATFVTSAKIPDHIVYAITKEVFDNFENFKKMHPSYAVLTKKSMLEGLSAPIHPGAMKYYQEEGLIK